MDLTWPLRIVEDRRDGVLVLALTGRLSATSAVGFDDGIAERVNRGDVRLVVDLARVDYISSAGLNALRASSARCARHHGTLALCGLTDPVRIALDLGGVLAELVIEPSREAAIRRAAAAF